MTCSGVYSLLALYAHCILNYIVTNNVIIVICVSCSSFCGEVVVRDNKASQKPCSFNDIIRTCIIKHLKIVRSNTSSATEDLKTITEQHALAKHE